VKQGPSEIDVYEFAPTGKEEGAEAPSRGIGAAALPGPAKPSPVAAAETLPPLGDLLKLTVEKLGPVEDAQRIASSIQSRGQRWWSKAFIMGFSIFV
jgi:hypothetical protein